MRRAHATSEMDLTRGNLFEKTIQFAIPFMLTSIFQLLYTTVDLWTVSEFGGGSLSMTAVGSNGPLINLLITVLLSLSAGSSVTMSIAKGAVNKEKAERILHTSFVIGVVGGILFSIIGIIMSPIILGWMDTPSAIMDKATEYLQIYFLGIPFLATVNFGAQMLRSLGDSKRPMKFLTLSGLVNVALDLLFVIVFKMDVVGVAVATIIAQGLAAFLIVRYFKVSKTTFVNFEWKKLKVSKEELKEILKIGLPAGLQGMAFSIPNIMIQSSLYTITNYYINGVFIAQNDVISGASACGQIEGYVFVILDAISVANTSITGQNYGAKKKENIKKGFWYSVIWMFIFWAICNTIGFIFYKQLFSIFIKESAEINKANAIAAGFERMKIMLVTYILDGIMDLAGYYLKGMKNSIAPAIITIICCTVFRIVFLTTVFQLDYFHTVFWLYAAFPISWVLAILSFTPTILLFQKRKFKELDCNELILEA